MYVDSIHYIQHIFPLYALNIFNVYVEGFCSMYMLYLEHKMAMPKAKIFADNVTFMFSMYVHILH